MKALILSAGQGSRLLPLTEDRPKCLLPVNSSRLIELQIRALIDCGIDEIAVVVGFRAAAVAHFLEELDQAGAAIRTLFNPFFNVADNLASCWMARGEMDRDFVVLNGDFVFFSVFAGASFFLPGVSCAFEMPVISPNKHRAIAQRFAAGIPMG